MANGKISGDPIATTAVGVYMAAIQGGANVQAPSTLFAANQFNLSDLSNPGQALLNLGGLSSALAASTYLTIVDAAAGYQPLAANLTSWAGVTRASGFDAFAATPSSVNLKALLTDETGSGAAVFATSPTLVTPNLGTPSAAVLTNATGYPAATTAVGGVVTLGAEVREKLTAARTYYVRSDGSDSNNGLSDSAGGAFLTIQKGVDVAKTLDSGGFDVSIQVRDGTRTVGATVNGPLVGGGALNIIGNIATPANCVVNTTSADCFFYTNGALGTVRGFAGTTTTSGDILHVDLGAYLTWGNMVFGACAGMHIDMGTEAKGFAAFNYTISGSATGHFHTGAPCTLFANPITITLTGTPAFSAYFAGTAGGYQIIQGITFSGAATGKRFLAHKNGVIDVGTTSLTYLPGNVAGTTESGGKYVGDLTYADIIGDVGTTDGVMVVTNGTVGNVVKNHASGAPGTAAFKNTGTSGNTVPLLDALNTWTLSQSFTATISPAANDGAALGTGTVAWADLFLASGGVINFANGDVSITHSADQISFTGAANGWRFGGLISPTANDGTSLGLGTLAFSDLFLADGAVINFNASNYTITHSAGLMTFSGPIITGAGPVTKNADFTLAATESSIIVTKGSSCVVTLGTATAGRRVRIKTHAAFTTVSASSNVVPRAGGAAGTAILAAVAGSWAELEGDGTNWQIMSGA